ncbi:MAG: hypothetical protein JW810_00185 [Sedimentisphaerales bacterium]|nr:hypothetical protein [Sedimentisphaerales bacterium]
MITSVCYALILFAHVQPAQRSIPAGQPDLASDDRAAVRQLVQKYEQAWQSTSSRSALEQILSDQAFVYCRPEADPNQVLNKAGTIRLYTQSARPADYAYAVHTVMTFGPLGYEMGMARFRNARGRIVQREILHFLAKDSAGWQCIGVFDAAPIRRTLDETPGRKPGVPVSPAVAEAQAAIHALVGRINQAWAAPQQGELIMKAVLSEGAFGEAIPNPQDPARAVIMNRQMFCSAFGAFKQNRPDLEHRHTVLSVRIVQAMAYERGVSSHTDAQGRVSKTNILNIFARDPSGWKLVFSAHEDHLQAVFADKPPAAGDSP